MDDKPVIVCVVGPTATGKSELAINLASLFSGEVVSADSMQIYKYMDIGTAKPALKEMRGVRHHMIDIAEPWEEYSVSRYAGDAGEAVKDILNRGKLPIVAGGTGLYLDALIYGRSFASRAQDAGLRSKLQNDAETQGTQALYETLKEKDPESAAKLHPNDIKRIIRALEVVTITGLTISEHNRRSKLIPAQFSAIKLGLTYSDRQELYGRIDARVDGMLENGLLDEVRALIKIPGVREGTAMQAIGYKELQGVIDGECELKTAIEQIKQSTRRYAKRQLTWFNGDKSIFWMDRSELSFDECLDRAARRLESLGLAKKVSG